MRKIIKISVTLLVVLLMLGIYDICKDKQFLKDNIVRLHVVANSDSVEDQQIKLIVKDAVATVVEEIQAGLSTKADVLDALQKSLPVVETTANNVLINLGVTDRVTVTLQKEAFDTRVYETFSLPAGIYDSLRVVIGDGEGKNWWCVAFPSLCISAESKNFADTATGAGFSQSVTNTITNRYQVRFFLMDCLGKLENLFR